MSAAFSCNFQFHFAALRRDKVRSKIKDRIEPTIKTTDSLLYQRVEYFKILCKGSYKYVEVAKKVIRGTIYWSINIYDDSNDCLLPIETVQLPHLFI